MQRFSNLDLLPSSIDLIFNRQTIEVEVDKKLTLKLRSTLKLKSYFAPMEIFSDEYFMNKALEQAQIAAESGEVPVGAIVVCNKQIIAKSYNQTEMLNDVTAHAEMLAITSAANYLGSKYLRNCELFVTLEPCPMCAGALKWAQMGRLVYGAADDGKGFMNYGRELLHPSTSIAFGLKNIECSHVLKTFFSQRR